MDIPKPNIMEAILPADVGKPKTGSTQEHLPIQAMYGDVVILKDGSAAMVLQTTAVNFDLLSENEQLAVISSFAQLLNSLSFPIQIVIRSKRLDITHYLETIKKVEQAQMNPLLKEMTRKYRFFVETLTSENEVLDKQFYVVVPVSYLEIGIMNNIERDIKKAVTVLIPRRDHIIKQLARIGLKATQLDSERLIKLLYDYYNETSTQIDIQAFVDKSISLKTPALNSSLQSQTAEPKKEVTRDEVKIVDLDQKTAPNEATKPNQPLASTEPQPSIGPHHMETRTSEIEEIKVASVPPLDAINSRPRPSSPFVVEELRDE